MKNTLLHAISSAAFACVCLLSHTASAQQAATPIVLRSDAFTQDEPLDDMGRAHRDNTVTLNAGETVDAAMNASFDAMLVVTGPQGFHAENDDAPGEGTNARLRFTAPVSGTYTLTATTYGPREYGAFYLLAHRIGSVATPVPYVAPRPFAPVATPTPPVVDPSTTTQTGGRVFGVFAGVTEYPSGSLFRAAEDAADLASAFQRRGVIRPGDSVVLTNGQATPAAIRQALLRFAPRMTARDTMVFYFGGHGSDGSISMPSGPLTTSELAEVLDRLPGRQLITLDTCHAGSFESIVAQSPQRLGLFSSTAGESSYTAERVNSSGWLIYFLLRSAQGQAPAGDDGVLQFDELASYIRQGYQQHNAPQTLVVRSGMGAGNPSLW